MIKFLASRKLTIYLLIFFLTILVVRTLTESEEFTSLLGCLALLFLNLLCSLCINFSSLKRKPGLFLFHICLIMLILFSGWGRLHFFKGYFELSEGGRFNGEFLKTFKGPFFDPDQIHFTLERGPVVTQISNTDGKNIYGSFLNIQEESRQKESIWLESGFPTTYQNVNFFLQHRKHGVSLFFKDKEERVSEKFFGLNMPLEMPRTNEFSLPDSQTKYKATLLIENYEYKRTNGTIPEGIKVLLSDGDSDIFVLQKGEAKKFKNGILQLLDIKLWDGILLTYDPSAFYMAILVLFSCVAILWHYTHITIGGSFINKINRFFSREDVLVPLILFIATLATYWQVCTFGFVWDDVGDILKNPHYTPLSVDSILQIWTGAFQNLYIPVTYTIWGGVTYFSRLLNLTIQNNGMDPSIFHMVNLSVHMLNVVLLFNILKKVLEKWNPSQTQTKNELSINWAAGYGALFFALHPVQVEPVVWINGLRGVLCSFFSFLFIRYWLCETIWGTGNRKNGVAQFVHFAMASGLLLLALWSKPTGVATPLIAFIIGVSVMKYSFKKTLILCSIWSSVALLFVGITQMVQPEAMMKVVTSIWTRPLIAGDSLAFYLFKIIFPMSLSVDYGRTPEAVFQNSFIYFAWLIPTALVVALWARKRFRPLLISFAIFVAALLPVLGLLPFTTQAISTVADRYLYMAMLGPSLAVSWILSRCSVKKPIMITIVSLWLCILGVHSALQKWNWNDEYTLFSHAIQENPKSYIGHHFVATHLLKQGRIREADSHFATMQRIRPSFEKSPHLAQKILEKGVLTLKLPGVPLDRKLAIEYNNLGNTLMDGKKYKEAVIKYEKAIEINPQMAQSYNNLSVVLHTLKRDKEALQRLEKALKINPYFIEAYINLAITLGDIGRHEEAVEVLKGALKIAPEDAEIHNNLGIIFVEKGEIEKGLEEFRAALRINPEYKNVYHNIEYAESFRKK